MVPSLVTASSAAVRTSDNEKTEAPSSRHEKQRHGYASTVHAAQGRTADSVVLHLDSARSTISRRESWYVAISRAGEGLRIFTDDRERLLAVIQRSMAQSIAHEVQVPKLEHEIAPTHGRSFGRGM
jgi:ATP-dependent exoDNAse (exonuclease V) alpha subunit